MTDEELNPAQRADAQRRDHGHRWLDHLRNVLAGTEQPVHPDNLEEHP